MISACCLLSWCRQAGSIELERRRHEEWIRIPMRWVVCFCRCSLRKKAGRYMSSELRYVSAVSRVESKSCSSSVRSCLALSWGSRTRLFFCWEMARGTRVLDLWTIVHEDWFWIVVLEQKFCSWTRPHCRASKIAGDGTQSLSFGMGCPICGALAFLMAILPLL